MLGFDITSVGAMEMSDNFPFEVMYGSMWSCLALDLDMMPVDHECDGEEDMTGHE